VNRTGTLGADTAIIGVGGNLNARALGGSSSRTLPRPASAIEADLTAARRQGFGGVLLAGGEPTLRRDLPALLLLARDNGLRTGLATNGRMLSYPRLRRDVLEAAPAYLRFEVHAPTAALHDRLADVPGAFDQTWHALSTTLIEGAEDLLVEAACTVTTPVLPHLGELAVRLAGLPRRARLRLRFVGPIAGLREHEWPPSVGAADAIGAVLARSDALCLPMVWEGFAPCLLGNHWQGREESLRSDAPVLGPKEAASAFPREGPGDRRRPPTCEECQRGDACPGAPTTALERDGESSLHPWQGPRANSFVMVQERELPGFTIRSNGCSVSELAPRPSRARHVLYVDQGVVSSFRTDTADFREERLVETKALQQLYVDLNPRATITEFRSDVRRVRRHPECDGCGQRDRCCQAVVLDREPPFVSQETWLQGRLATLRGRVLDVGAGENLYHDVLSPLAQSGLVEYEALDPDRGALGKLADLGLAKRTWPVRIEDAKLPREAYDAVLALRSPNHFVDVRRALQVITDALRPGGRLMLCDSLAFGLLRQPHQAAYADAMSPGHHHYRNWSSEQFLAALAAHPLELTSHVPVSPATSDLWLLELRRVDGDRRPGTP
jgi:SAM-dependent methyltransferase